MAAFFLLTFLFSWAVWGLASLLLPEEFDWRRFAQPHLLKKHSALVASVIISFFAFWGGFAQQTDFPVLKGPYLGQKPPGMTPEVFAPGIISTEEKYELNSVFSPQGDEFYYEISTTTPEEKKKGEYFYIIMVSKQMNGVWTKPEMVPFSGKYSTMDMCFSPDGNRLYFTSDRPNPWDVSPKNNIWYVERTGNGWSNPVILPPPVYTPEVRQGQVSLAANGTLYFRTGDDLFYSKYKNGKFSNPVILSEAVNSPYAESKPYISPDESFLLFVRYDMPRSINGGRGLYISFRGEDGSWKPAKNTNIDGSLPKLTPDGKYFFFSRGGDIYWVDAKIIEELKPSELELNSSSNGDGPSRDWPVLQGPYFGQKVPKGGAEVFLDGIISKLNEDEMCAAFTADAKEFYYNAHHKGNWAIFMTKEVDGQWMRPAPLPMTSDYTDRDFTMSPDGNRIFFGSNRPRNEGEDPAGSLDIFVTERLPAGRWSEPRNIGHPVNTDRGENYPSCAWNGNLYFFSSWENGLGGCDIYVSRWENGRYSAPENLGSAVNSAKHDWDAVVAPDESFIIFSSQDRADSVGKQDLYISYRKVAGGWTAAKNMGRAVNSPYDEICPSLSLDGKGLFFTSRRRGKADIFWIDAKIIEDLGPNDSKFQ